MRAGTAFMALAALLLVASSAQAQTVGLVNPETPTPVTLYMHLDGLQDFPINTQPPNPAFADAIQAGVQGHTTSCLPPVPQFPILGQEKHTYYGYSSPGYVEYDILENGRPRYHPERGLSFDVNLDTTAPMTLHWYLETQTGAPTTAGVDPDQVPVVLPNVEVRATMRTGDAVGIGDASYNSGPVIAEGTAVGTLAGPASQGVEYSTNGTRHIYHFAVPMEVKEDTIPKATGYNVRIDVLLQNDACQQGMLMPDFVRVHTSDGHRPRLDLTILDPIRVEYLHPQFVGSELYIHASLNSPWGNYDVDEAAGGLDIQVDGPSPATLEQAAFTQRTHEHDHHQEAVDVSYVWRYVAQDAQPGDYTVRLKGWNDQHTGQAEGVATFRIARNAADNSVVGCGDLQGGESGCVEQVGTEGVEKKDSPGAGLMVVLAAVVALAMAMRRR